MTSVARATDTISHGGTITSGSPDVFANGLSVARLGDPVECDTHGSQTITSGSPDVNANGLPVARLGDTISCGATITSGSPDVNVS